MNVYFRFVDSAFERETNKRKKNEYEINLNFRWENNVDSMRQRQQRKKNSERKKDAHTTDTWCIKREITWSNVPFFNQIKNEKRRLVHFINVGLNDDVKSHQQHFNPLKINFAGSFKETSVSSGSPNVSQWCE